MAVSDTELEAMRLVHEIRDHTDRRELQLLAEKVTSLTKILFTNNNIIYSPINKEFENCGVVQLFVDSFFRFNEQTKRDVLRLLNVFLKTSPSLRTTMANNFDFVDTLLKVLSNRDSWNKVDKIKYYINIASYLFLCLEPKQSSIFRPIRRIVRSILSQTKHDTDYSKRMLCLIFYASCEKHDIKNSLEDFDDEYNQIMCKNIIAVFIENIRDYLFAFKQFYDGSLCETGQYIKYLIKTEFSFDQICNCITYYTQFNEQLRQNLFQSGLYDLLSGIFLINNIPDLFILHAINIFMIPSLDEVLKNRFAKQHKPIIDTIKSFHTSDSPEVMGSIERLLQNYESNLSSSIPTDLNQSSSPSGILITIPQSESKSISMTHSLWGSLDVENWLSENNLDSCRKQLTSLTGRGLNQMKLLNIEKDGKFKLIKILTSKLEMDLVTVFELLGALENL